jgi:hypothetical protein
MTLMNVKKSSTVIALLAGAASVYSQGLVSMNDYSGSFTIQIFNWQPVIANAVEVSYGGYTVTEEMGTSPNLQLNSPGTTVFAPGSALGTGYSVQLLAAPGAGDALSTLVPTGPVITTWYTPAGGNPAVGLNGYWYSIANAAIAGAAPGTAATVALAAWYNDDGVIASVAAAQSIGDPWGVSITGNVDQLGGNGVPPPNLPASIVSFSLVAEIPEPSTTALCFLGASAFLISRRKLGWPRIS